MRHSRRAVMAERYKLYAKKNIFNSRYFVRNMQIGMIVVVLMVMVVGTIALVSTDSESDATVAEVEVSVKDALFSNSEEVNTMDNTTTEKTTAKTSEDTIESEELILAEKVQTELANTVTEVVSNVAVEEEVSEVVVEETDAFDNRCIANVEETLNIRSNPSSEADFVGQMNNGAIAKVVAVEGEWTKIKSGDVEGYVMTEYVLTGEAAAQFAKDYVTLRGTVLEDGVNVRAEKSTDSDILVVMDKDDTITVLDNQEEENAVEEGLIEETETAEVADEVNVAVESTEAATEVSAEENTVNAIPEKATEETAENDIEWLTVMLEDGQTGYVAAELLEIDELYEIAVSAEELQRQAEEEAARKAAEEAAAVAAAAAAEAQKREEQSNSYEGATTTPVSATESGDLIGTFTITAYCGCSKCGTGSNRTASGTTPTEGRTIAADTSILPFGTQVVIGGVVYTVEDTGSGIRGNHIDIFFATHAKALQFGRRTMNVYRY